VGTAKFSEIPEVRVEMDRAGKPTGVVYGNTWTFTAIEAMVPQLSPVEEASSLIYSLRGLNKFGVTSLIDAGTRWGYPRADRPVADLAKDDRLSVRMPFVVLQLGEGANANMVDAQFEAITKTAPISPGQNLYPQLAHGHEYRGVGETLRAETHDHENFENPAVIIDPAQMHALVDQDVAKLIKRRMPFRMHISYNENITPFLDALEKLNERMPLDGLKWSLEHAETISPENIERVRKLGGGIALDQKMALHGDAFIKSHGRDAALLTPRLRYLVDSGTPVAMTTDAFRAATFNPWIGISWMVTGRAVSGSEVLAKENRLSRAEALKLFTGNAAWFMNTQSEMGMIAPGYLADFAVLDRDYFTIPEDQIKSISSVLTVLDGKVVFGGQEYSDQSPLLPAILPTWSPVKYFGSYYQAK
jgi:predicted amidohydrolase YtcJ